MGFCNLQDFQDYGARTFLQFGDCKQTFVHFVG